MFTRPLAGVVVLALGCLPLRADTTKISPTRPRNLISRTYAVADLVAPLRLSEMCRLDQRLIHLIVNCVGPREWTGQGGFGTIEYSAEQKTLTIEQMPDIQEMIEDLLQQLRRLRAGKTKVEVRVLAVPFVVLPLLDIASQGEVFLLDREQSRLLCNWLTKTPSATLNTFAPFVVETDYSAQISATMSGDTVTAIELDTDTVERTGPISVYARVTDLYARIFHAGESNLIVEVDTALAMRKVSSLTCRPANRLIRRSIPRPEESDSPQTAFGLRHETRGKILSVPAGMSAVVHLGSSQGMQVPGFRPSSHDADRTTVESSRHADQQEILLLITAASSDFEEQIPISNPALVTEPAPVTESVSLEDRIEQYKSLSFFGNAEDRFWLGGVEDTSDPQWQEKKRKEIEESLPLWNPPVGEVWVYHIAEPAPSFSVGVMWRCQVAMEQFEPEKSISSYIVSSDDRPRPPTKADGWKWLWYVDLPTHLTFDRIEGGIE